MFFISKRASLLKVVSNKFNEILRQMCHMDLSVFARIFFMNCFLMTNKKFSKQYKPYNIYTILYTPQKIIEPQYCRELELNENVISTSHCKYTQFLHPSLKTSTSSNITSNPVLAIYASLFCVKLRTTSSFVAQMKHDNHKLPSSKWDKYKFKS